MAGRTAAGTATDTLPLRRTLPALAALLLVFGTASCAPSISPNTYNASAVQQANKTERGVVIGVRQVDVRASGTTGAVIGGAAGGIAGAQAGDGATSAFGALGGSVLGGLIGAGTEHAMDDTRAFEYIVREDTKQLVSVTQKDDTPLAIGQHVLVIAGNQARIVPDYTVQLPDADADKAKKDKADAKPAVPAAAAAPASPAANATPAAAPASGAPDSAAPASGSSDSSAPASGSGGAAGDAPKDGAAKPADSSILPSTTKLPDGTVSLPTDGSAPASATTSGSADDALGKVAGKVFTAPSASVPSAAVPASGIPDVSLDSVGGAVDSAVGK